MSFMEIDKWITRIFDQISENHSSLTKTNVGLMYPDRKIAIHIQ